MSRDTCTRRTVLRTSAGAVAGGAALAASSPASAQASFDGWLDDVGNYDGVVDETGSDEVTVEVGTEANGGNFGFGPAAVRVDPGTTVTWEWVAGNHNVVAEDGSFESELTGETGFTFSQTFEEAGVVKYACTPHRSMGMKGVVVVGDAGGGGGSSTEQSMAASGSGGSGGGASDGMSTADWSAVGVALAMVAALLSPLGRAAMRNGGDDRRQRGAR
ncbi:halocyanin domain-containing protein [Halomicrobium salinisoli]|uniref:halocyanin domain-containing protein n=1 Tax=Halomicrobium salinisoli TaxID=2878391 RepID=UPI001CF07BEC|nr:halocyanin domain-containing protein [Halomicrobium salinisoli]